METRRQYAGFHNGKINAEAIDWSDPFRTYSICRNVLLRISVGPHISDGLGDAFNLFRLVSWIHLTPLCLWGAYKLEVSEESISPRGPEGISR